MEKMNILVSMNRGYVRQLKAMLHSLFVNNTGAKQTFIFFIPN